MWTNLARALRAHEARRIIIVSGTLLCASFSAPFAAASECSAGEDALEAFANCVVGPILRASDIVFAIDNSESVKNAGRLSHQKDFVAATMRSLPSGRNVAVLAFNSRVDRVVAPTRLNEASIDGILAQVDGIADTNNLTWMSGAIDEACEITRAAEGEGALVIASDGKPTTPDGTHLDVEGASALTLERAEYFKRHCSVIVVIAVETDQESDRFLREVASAGAMWNPTAFGSLAEVSGTIKAGIAIARKSFPAEAVVFGLAKERGIASLRGIELSEELCVEKYGFPDPNEIEANLKEIGFAVGRYYDSVSEMVADVLARRCDVMVLKGSTAMKLLEDNRLQFFEAPVPVQR